MNDMFGIVTLSLAGLVVILQIVSLLRRTRIELAPIQQALQQVEQSYERTERTVRDEIARNREETASALGKFREELAGTLHQMSEQWSRHLLALTTSNDDKLERVRDTVAGRLAALQEDNGTRIDRMRREGAQAALATRTEVNGSLKAINDTLVKTLTEISAVQKRELALLSDQFGKLIASNEDKLERLKAAVDGKLKAIQEDNAKRLEQMRATVDDKLHGTLEKRLGEAFGQVSTRLEQVYKGLGEMQTLAVGVGDLKRVLSNVKTRGTWGEVQLGALLDQVLTRDQYATHVAVRDTQERVEFAIRLPGRKDEESDSVWLPIDAKFPLADYEKLLDAQERADGAAAEEAGKALEARLKRCAQDIAGKYLHPPKTTDFAILYLPIEGLFAEVLRRPGLAEAIQRDWKVVLAGPTTLWSLLNSLQMGFRTLAVQKRSSEVWKLLAAVKTEWSRYGEVLDLVQKRIQQASESVDKARKRTGIIGQKLKSVEELPAAEATRMLDGSLDIESPSAPGPMNP